LDVLSVGRSVEGTVAGLALLRNLALLQENTSHFTSNPRALPCLAATLHTGMWMPRAIAFSASALSALCYHEQRAKAALRKMQGLPQQLIALAKEAAWQDGDEDGEVKEGQRYVKPAREAVRVLSELLELQAPA
jgi:hypothetical protein